MQDELKTVIKIHVKCTSAFEVKACGKTVNQVLFEGTVEGECFNGNILPGGVDTQVYEADSGHLSARYMLEGIDNSGEKCRIFVENEAWQGEEYTHPKMLTDSKALAWLNSAELKGRIGNEGGELLIEILM